MAVSLIISVNIRDISVCFLPMLQYGLPHNQQEYFVGYVVKSDLVNPDLIYFLLVNSDLSTGRLGRLENKVLVVLRSELTKV